MTKLRNLLFSGLFTVGIFLALLFLFSTASVIEQFQVFPHDAGGGFALFLLELVLAFAASSVGGLLLFRRLSCGYWFENSTCNAPTTTESLNG